MTVEKKVEEMAASMAESRVVWKVETKAAW